MLLCAFWCLEAVQAGKKDEFSWPVSDIFSTPKILKVPTYSQHKLLSKHFNVLRNMKLKRTYSLFLMLLQPLPQVYWETMNWWLARAFCPVTFGLEVFLYFPHTAKYLLQQFWNSTLSLDLLWMSSKIKHCFHYISPIRVRTSKSLFFSHKIWDKTEKSSRNVERTRNVRISTLFS